MSPNKEKIKFKIKPQILEIVNHIRKYYLDEIRFKIKGAEFIITDPGDGKSNPPIECIIHNNKTIIGINSVCAFIVHLELEDEIQFKFEELILTEV